MDPAGGKQTETALAGEKSDKAVVDKGGEGLLGLVATVDVRWPRTAVLAIETLEEYSTHR